MCERVRGWSNPLFMCCTRLIGGSRIKARTFAEGCQPVAVGLLSSFVTGPKAESSKEGAEDAAKNDVGTQARARPAGQHVCWAVLF